MIGKIFYTDAEIAGALQVLVDHGVDIDSLPLEATVEDLMVMAEGIERPT